MTRFSLAIVLLCVGCADEGYRLGFYHPDAFDRAAVAVDGVLIYDGPLHSQGWSCEESALGATCGNYYETPRFPRPSCGEHVATLAVERAGVASSPATFTFDLCSPVKQRPAEMPDGPRYAVRIP